MTTKPLTPADSNLQDFPHTPLFRARLFGSSFHARASDSEWRAGVTLWLKSWDQVPAGSLPDDEIELCRLAELARDLKTWRKLKEGALRGWILCTDGRLYHPVVAEGVNTALEAKIKQRLKTAKARIGALEKHLKEATTDAEKARITEEISKVKQTLSQGLSQTLSHAPREGEVKGEGEGKGLDSSVPDGTGGKPPSTPKPAKEKTPAEQEKSRLWAWIKTAMVDQQTCQSIQDAGVLAGKLSAKYGADVFIAALREGERMSPGNAHTYVIGLCETAIGKRVPLGRPGQMTDEQREATNAAETQKAKDLYRARYGRGDVVDAETRVVDQAAIEGATP